MWKVYKFRDLPALLILIIQLDMNPRTLNPSLMWEGEWHSLPVHHLHFPCLHECSRPSGQEWSYTMCPVWHLSLIDGLQMLSCEKAHYIVIKISFSVGDNVNSLSKMPTVINWLSSEPIAWPCSQVSAKDSSLIPQGRQESSVEHLISFSVCNTIWITTKTFQTTWGSVLGSPASQTRKNLKLLTHAFCWNLLAPKRSTINADRATCHNKVRTTHGIKTQHHFLWCLSLEYSPRLVVCAPHTYLWICESVLNTLAPPTPSCKH